jgi:hypothetical protein
MAQQTFTSGQVLTAAEMTTLQTNDYNQTVSTKTGSYVLVAADKGTRIAMNSASATTVTVNTSLFNAGDTLYIQNIGAGTCTVTAGTATVTTASSLALAQWGGGTLYFTSASAAIFFSQQSATYGTATGGTGTLATPPTGYAGVYFNSSLTLTVAKTGIFDVMAFGGGGGGGYGNNINMTGGGGGAGAYAQQTIYLTAGSYNVIIGAGGASVTEDQATNGSGTSIGNTAGNFAVGGGGGAGIQSTQAGQIGGSGGGGGRGSNGGASSAAATGYAGGNSAASANGGGGGGASASGSAGSGTTGGAGGAGIDIATFTGNASTFKAGGGGGGGGGAGGAGGSSVGGAGGTAGGSSAAANSASGGGGGATLAGGNGGSGVLYIRWKV